MGCCVSLSASASLSAHTTLDFNVKKTHLKNEEAPLEAKQLAPYFMVSVSQDSKPVPWSQYLPLSKNIISSELQAEAAPELLNSQHQVVTWTQKLLRKLVSSAPVI